MRAVGTWIWRLIDSSQTVVNPDDTSPSSLPPQRNVFRRQSRSKQPNHREVKRQKSEDVVNGVVGACVNNGATPDPPNTTTQSFPPPVYPSGPGMYSSPPVDYFPAVQQPYASYSPVPQSSQPKEVYYLPKFNERCSQQKLPVEYTAENHGSPHAPKWVMKCLGESHDCSSFPVDMS